MLSFKLEHHRQKLLPLPQFFLRMSKYLVFAFAVIFFSLAMGITGYHYLGKLNFLDSFHMSAMILTGMGPVSEMSTPAAKIFSSFYALYSGIAFLSITAVFFTPIIHRILHILHVEDSTTNNS